MNELFDKLTLRFIFTAVILIALFLYKHTHRILYPSARTQILQRFFPSRNSADSFHLFSRILGIGIIFSEFYFKMDQGFLIATFDFLIRAISAFILYLGSLYVIESIVLYNFEYNDEVIKRKNLSYSLICLSHALGVALNLKIVLKVASESLIMLIFLWLLTMVLLGFATKTYTLMSRLSFNRLLLQKNMAVSVSYMGFFLGWSLIISSSLNNELLEIKWYTIQVILKILLSLIILPIFMYGLKYLFNLENDIEKDGKSETQDLINVDVGYGIHEGACFFTSCLLTIVITGRVYFGNFYPVF